jgi:hypothetical protein
MWFFKKFYQIRLIVQHPAVVPVKQVVETQEEKDQFLCLI